MLYRLLCVLAACSLAAVSAFADDKSANDANDLQGVWQAVDVEANGDKLSSDEVKNLQVVIKADEIFAVKPEGEDPRNKFKLDPRKTPKTIDLTPIEAGNKGKLVAGIYSLKDGRLTICINIFSEDTARRPSEFKTRAGDGVVLAVLERAKTPVPRR